MTETWRLDNDYYVLYTESSDIMRRIRRYYKDFKPMAEYFIHRTSRVKARQYLVPIKRKRVAIRLSKIA